MEWNLQCLSPVHIGTGNKLEPYEYILNNQRYIRVNIDAVLQRLSDEETEELAAWLIERSDQLAGPDSRQTSRVRGETTLYHFSARNPVLQEALLEDEALSFYRARGSLSHPLQVTEQVKDATALPLIPGSSIKGALRTALAYLALKEMDVNARNDLGNALASVLNRSIRKDRRVRKDNVGQVLEEYIFRCGRRRSEREGVQYNDIQYDLMRCISVSDTINPQAELLVTEARTFVEKKEGGLSAQTTIPLEMHAPGNRFSVRIDVDAKLLQVINGTNKKDRWIGFEERVRRAFGNGAVEALAGSQDRLEEAVMQRIVRACRLFYQDVAAEESQWAQTHGATALRPFYEGMVGLNEGMVPLRLGWGSHFMATTLLLALRSDAAWKQTMEGFMRQFDLGVPRGRNRTPREQRKIDVDSFPRSRRLAAVNHRPVAPFGWVVLAPEAVSLPGTLIRVEDLLQRPAARNSRRRPEGRTAFPQEQPAAPRPREVISIKAARKEMARQADSTQRIKVGGQINAEILENDGRKVRVRVLANMDEELVFNQAYYPKKAGEKVKLRVVDVDAEGKVTKVRP